MCPACKVGTSYELLHRALDAHSKHRLHSSPIHGSTSHNHQEEDVDADAEEEVEAVVEVTSHPPETRVNGEHTVTEAPPTPNVGSDGTDVTPRDTGSRPGPQVPQQGGSPQRDTPRLLPDPTMAQPHGDCTDRAKKFHYLLGTLGRGPRHPNTLVCGDSHLTAVDGKDIDPTDDQVRRGAVRRGAVHHCSSSRFTEVSYQLQAVQACGVGPWDK